MRNLGLIVALWLSALLPTNSLALGLGEIEVNSFLNQPLNAEIEVISARPGEIDDLLVSLHLGEISLECSRPGAAAIPAGLAIRGKKERGG